MSDAILGSALSAAAVVIVALITFYLNARSQIAAKWRDQKIEYYRDFFDALAQYVGGKITQEKKEAFAREYNNVHLIASRAVLSSLHAYQAHCRDSERNGDLDTHNKLLADLVNKMRIDLGMRDGEPLSAAHVQLLSFTR